jgi:hypothetical protein
MPMDDMLEIATEHGALRAVISHWAALDSGNYDAVAAGFAKDGVWHRQGKELKGPGMVSAAMAERPKGARTRHIVTNVLSTVKSEVEVDIDFYMTVFSHNDEADAPSPAPMNVPNSVGLARATVRREGSQWKIVYLKSAATFQRK